MTHENWVMVWLGALIAPLILYGAWMRVKLYQSEEGQQFLIDREKARQEAEDEAYYDGDDNVELTGKLTRSRTDQAALEGSHGQETASILKKAIPFFGGYLVYAVIVGVAGYVMLF